MKVTQLGYLDPELLREQEREWNRIPDPELDRFFMEQEHTHSERRRKEKKYKRAEKASKKEKP